jgi:DNA-directed RNA polymerase subunit RPC12/RpoP
MKIYKMGVKCPKCNSKVYLKGIIFRNGDVYYFCSECGYKYVTQWEGYSIGEVILMESTDHFSSEDLISEISEYPDYYAYYIIENSIGGALSGPIPDSKKLDEYLEYIDEIRPKTHITKIMIGRFVGGKLIIEEI